MLLTSVIAGVVFLVVGHGIAAASVMVWGPPGDGAPQPVPLWIFAAAWTLLFPCVGAAFGAVLDAKRKAAALTEVPHVIAVGAAAMLVAVAWMPIACAAQNPWVPVMLDVLGALVWMLAAGSFARVSRPAG